MAEIILCMVSYEDVKGMYYNTKIDVEMFDREEVEEEIEEYYKKIGVEEYRVADTWSDENDTLNYLIDKGESLSSFLDRAENIQDNIEILEKDIEIVKMVENHTSPDIEDLLNYINNNITVYDNLDVYYSELWNNAHGENNEFYHMFYWMSSDQRESFLTHQGYTFARTEDNKIVEFNK